MSDFSGALTEEEEYLLERYKILREKKRVLQKLKEKTEIKVKPAVKREAQDTSKTPEDAKKKAMMLVASGCVKISKTSVDREFKRVRTSEKKLTKESLSDQEIGVSVEKKNPSKTAMKEMYSSRKYLKDTSCKFKLFKVILPRVGYTAEKWNVEVQRFERRPYVGQRETFLSDEGPFTYTLFVRSGRAENDNDSFHGYRGYREQRKGNTIFIKGCGLKEDIVKTAFNKFGTVIDARYEKERNHGFVTFKTCEEAEKAIEEMNGIMASGVHIEVLLARKQLHMENTRGNQPPWTSRDSRPRDHHAVHGRSTESRELKTYKDDDFFD